MNILFQKNFCGFIAALVLIHTSECQNIYERHEDSKRLKNESLALPEIKNNDWTNPPKTNNYSTGNFTNSPPKSNQTNYNTTLIDPYLYENKYDIVPNKTYQNQGLTTTQRNIYQNIPSFTTSNKNPSSTTSKYPFTSTSSSKTTTNKNHHISTGDDDSFDIDDMTFYSPMPPILELTPYAGNFNNGGGKKTTKRPTTTTRPRTTTTSKPPLPVVKGIGPELKKKN